MNIFLPKVTTAITSLSGVVNHLNDTTAKPEYEATFTYDGLDGVVTHMPQVFRLELYGTKTLDDGTVVHETVAHKEYSLSKGESAEISIGYYDAAGDVDLSVYDRGFATDIWYVSPGLGDVYTYIHTDAAHAANKKRITGFITDYNDGVADVDYLFRSVKLPTPEIEPVIVGFTPDNATTRRPVAYWGVRVVNYKDYEAYNDNGDIKVGVGFASTNNYTVQIPVRWEVPISGSDMSNKDGVNIYPAGISLDMTADKGDRAQWRNRLNAYACGEGKINSDTYEHLDGRWFVPYYMTDTTYFGATFKKLAAEDYYDGQSVVTGAFTFDGTNLNYNGVLSYNDPSKQGIEAYYKVEVYAYDASGNPITLYMSDDKLMTNTSGSSSTISTDPVNITLTNNENLNLGDYHDYHVAVWYSANSNDDNHSNNYQGMIRYYFETEDQYVTGNYRNNGFIKYLDSTTGEYKYYYSAVLAYRDLCENNNYAKLYMENATNAVTVSSAPVSDGILIMWTQYDTTNVNNLYNVEEEIYAVPSEFATKEELDAYIQANGLSPIVTVVDTVEGTQTGANQAKIEALAAAAGTPVTFDTATNIYYALARVKDAVTTEAFYGEKVMVRVAPKPPAPIIGFTCVDYNTHQWYAYLVNWKEFVGTNAIVHLTKSSSINNLTEMKYNNQPVVIDTAHPQSVGGFNYATYIGFNGGPYDNYIAAYATVGDYTTDVYYHNQDTRRLWFTNSYVVATNDSDLKFNAKKLERIASTDHINITAVDSTTYNFDYQGTFTYATSATGKLPVFARTEVYASKGGVPYTLYMGDEIYTNGAPNPMQISINFDTIINLSEYSDFRVAVWLYASGIYNDSHTKPNDGARRNYYCVEITSDMATALGGTRVDGVITDISSGETKYYYVSSITNANNTINTRYQFITEDQLTGVVVPALQAAPAPAPPAPSPAPPAPGNGSGNNTNSTNSNNSAPLTSMMPMPAAGSAIPTETGIDAGNGENTDNTANSATDQNDANNQTNTDNTAGDENQGVDNTTPTDVNADPASDPANTDSTNTDNSGNGENQDNNLPENPAIVPDTQNLGGSESANTDNTAGDSTQATDTQNTDSQATDNNDNGGDSSANGN